MQQRQDTVFTHACRSYHYVLPPTSSMVCALGALCFSSSATTASFDNEQHRTMWVHASWADMQLHMQYVWRLPASYQRRA